MKKRMTASCASEISTHSGPTLRKKPLQFSKARLSSIAKATQFACQVRRMSQACSMLTWMPPRAAAPGSGGRTIQRVFRPATGRYQYGDLHLAQRNGLPRRDCQACPQRLQIDWKTCCIRCGIDIQQYTESAHDTLKKLRRSTGKSCALTPRNRHRNPIACYLSKTYDNRETLMLPRHLRSGRQPTGTIFAVRCALAKERKR